MNAVIVEDEIVAAQNLERLPILFISPQKYTSISIQKYTI